MQITYFSLKNRDYIWDISILKALDQKNNKFIFINRLKAIKCYKSYFYYLSIHIKFLTLNYLIFIL